MGDMESKHFTYIDHGPDGCQNHIVFECDANSITEAHECYEKTQGTDPTKQSWVGVSWVGVTIEKGD